MFPYAKMHSTMLTFGYAKIATTVIVDSNLLNKNNLKRQKESEKYHLQSNLLFY